jgi:threonine 3-dehydrogenase
MYAVIKSERGPGISIGEVDEPSYDSDGVLIKIERAAICGTDLHIYSWNDWAESRINRLPLILGHELSGKVVEVGSNVRNINIGDLVSIETHVVDGTCYQCRTGRMHICRNLRIIGLDVDGGFAEYISVPALNVWVNDVGIEPDIAAIEEPLGNAVHAVYPDGSEDLAGKYALVLGCGPIGLMSIAVLKEAGLEKIIAAEVSEYRLGFASKMGADILINPLKEDIVNVVMAETRGRGADIVLEMSGSPQALLAGINATTCGGRISLLGLPDVNVSMDLSNDVILRGIRLVGITGRRMFETWYQVKGLLNIPSFRSRIRSLITHKMDMSSIDDGFNLLRGKEAIKIVLRPKFT